MEKKGPELDEMGQPVWWHHHGTKMKFQKMDSIEGKWVVIRGSAAEVRVMKITDNQFIVKYRIDHGALTEINGLINFTKPELMAAFLGVPHVDEYDGYSKWLLDRFGGDIARQRTFIRWRSFLNIPGPGTGHDGDANVSIKIESDIAETIHALIK